MTLIFSEIIYDTFPMHRGFDPLLFKKKLVNFVTRGHLQVDSSALVSPLNLRRQTNILHVALQEVIVGEGANKVLLGPRKYDEHVDRLIELKHRSKHKLFGLHTGHLIQFLVWSQRRMIDPVPKLFKSIFPKIQINFNFSYSISN